MVWIGWIVRGTKRTYYLLREIQNPIFRSKQLKFEIFLIIQRFCCNKIALYSFIYSFFMCLQIGKCRTGLERFRYKVGQSRWHGRRWNLYGRTSHIYGLLECTGKNRRSERRKRMVAQWRSRKNRSRRIPLCNRYEMKILLFFPSTKNA